MSSEDKTVDVRVFVCVESDGDWRAYGHANADEDYCVERTYRHATDAGYWLTATLARMGGVSLASPDTPLWVEGRVEAHGA